jgi:hypothetical protein
MVPLIEELQQQREEKGTKKMQHVGEYIQKISSSQSSLMISMDEQTIILVHHVQGDSTIQLQKHLKSLPHVILFKVKKLHFGIRMRVMMS